MKKLSKISLLGEVNLLTKEELKQLVGATRASDGCIEYVDMENLIRKCISRPCATAEQGQPGYCGWNKGTKNCECLVFF